MICEHCVGSPTGEGKTFLTCALAQAARRCGFSGRYFRPSRLLVELAPARVGGLYPQFMDRLQKIRLLVLNGYGLTLLTPTERPDVLEILEERVGRWATLITSQPPLDY